MKKYIPFRIERYFLSASIASLIKQGKSVYEIGTVLKASDRLVCKFIFTDALRMQLEENNRRFTDKFINEFPDDHERYKAMDKYNAYYHPYFKTTSFTCQTFRRSFDGWLRKNTANDALFHNVISTEEKTSEDVLPLNTTFAIINAHFDGSSVRSIAKQFNCSLKQLKQLYSENNMQPAADDNVVRIRLKEAIRSDAPYQFIREHFKKTPAREIKMIQHQHRIFEKIKYLPYRENYMNNPKQNGIKKPSFTERQTELLNQRKCLRYFSLGNEVPQIARIMGLPEQKIILLLRKTQAM